MDRNIKHEAKILAKMAKSSPSNKALQERAEMAAAATKSHDARRVYLAEYPSKDLPKAPDYSSKERPPEDKVPSDRDFVVAWQRSSSTDEAAERMGVEKHYGWVACKAAAMKRHGVRLKSLGRRPQRREGALQVDDLNAIIEQMEAGPKAVAG